MDPGTVRDYLRALQGRIVAALVALDGGTFASDTWKRAEGGGGVTRILEGGELFERAGVGFSDVTGTKLPPSASAHRPEIAGGSWEAMGVSLVLHPRNPHVPTVHMNVRFFVAGHVWWFGGGMDLTPYYPVEEDCAHFHRANRDALAGFPGLHARLKKAGDEYFFLKPRNEPRGIGGTFFDDFSEGGFDRSFEVMRAVGDAFLPAYVPIVEKRRNAAYGEREREFMHRRGRRGVQPRVGSRRSSACSRGRAESTMSMPPAVRWRYDWQPEPGFGSEARLGADAAARLG
jgi:coproporphyrinogen III oxidase